MCTNKISSERPCIDGTVTNSQQSLLYRADAHRIGGKTGFPLPFAPLPSVDRAACPNSTDCRLSKPHNGSILRETDLFVAKYHDSICTSFATLGNLTAIANDILFKTLSKKIKSEENSQVVSKMPNNDRYETFSRYNSAA